MSEIGMDRVGKGVHHTLPATPLPPRPERVDALRELMGEPNEGVRQLVNGIRSATGRQYRAEVLPLVERHWPEILGRPFGIKLELATCQLYAAAPYTVLFCAPNRPWMIQIATELANKIPMSPRRMGIVARLALELFARLACAREQRRIVLVAAFIATVDHVFDHCMTEPPIERGRKLRAVLEGTETPDGAPLRLTAALRGAMSHDLSSAERGPFEAAMARVLEWVDAEVNAMTEVADPSGRGHRIAGVEGTIDGLLFPVYRYTGEAARRWMYDVSLFIQMMDDYLDYEQDATMERITPVISGEWTWVDIRDMWRTTVSGIETLTRNGGLHAPHYIAFVRDAYVLMLGEVLEGMSSGIAD